MTRCVSLNLEALETRLTPATVRAVAVILPASQTNPSSKVAVQTVNPITVTGQSKLPVIQPAIGASLGGGGSNGSSGGGGIGGTTGDPAGPGPGS
jgi:hypothetical protein